MPKKTYTPKPHTYHPGEVGYRNRGRQTGLDPFDTSREAGRMEGLFYRHLLRGTLRTRNPIVVFILLTGGVLLTGGAMGMASGMVNDPYMAGDFGIIFCLGIMVVFMAGLGLLMLRAGLTNAAQMSGFTRWWRRQFKKQKKGRKK
ncbi:MAG: hypothetical protein DPW16_02290 [Chloroflexi bacterium]|nr:hypothetical protein [Chloroflexota bacterium]